MESTPKFSSRRDNHPTTDNTTTKTNLTYHSRIAKMAPSQLPPIFNATSTDIEMLLAAQCHLGSKNMQTHMESYLWKTRPDGINVINIGKTWYVCSPLRAAPEALRP